MSTLHVIEPVLNALKTHLEVLAYLLEIIRQSEGAEGQTTELHLQRPRRYMLTTFFLRRIYDYLMQQEEESIAYLTGFELEPTAVLDEIICFNMDRQEMAYVSGDIVSSTEALVMMSDRGYEMRGTAHCHPGHGRAATTPSVIDYAHHHRLEQGGYEALGIIMTRDGHVRFYTDKLPYEVTIVGKDGAWVEEATYKLEMDFTGEDDFEASA